MKLTNFLIAASAGLCLAACRAPAERTIERPLAGVRNTRIIEIDKIVLTDTATVVYIDAFFNPGWWIQMDTTTHLYGGGKKYMVTGTEGIELRKKHWMSESGEDSFVLFFEPIDPRLKSVDLIEGDPDDYFKIWDIRLDGRKSLRRSSSPIPAKVRKVDYRKAALPEPLFNSALTAVNIHLTGQQEGVEIGLEYSLFGMLEINAEQIPPLSVADGIYTYEIPLYGPTTMMLSVGNNHQIVILEPGVENNIWVDLVEMSRRSSRYNRDMAGDRPAVATDNRYAAVNAALADNPDIIKDWNLNFLGIAPDVLLRMTELPTSEVARDLRGRYDSLILKLDAAEGLSRLERELITARIGGDYLFGISQIPHRLKYAQREGLGLGQRTPLPEGIVPFEFSDSDIDILFEGLDLQSMMGPYTKYPGYSFFIMNDPRVMRLGLRNSFPDYVKRTQRIMDYTETFEEIPAEFQSSFDSIPDPVFGEAVALKKAVIQRLVDEAAAKEGYFIRDVPDAADDKLFDAIAKQYAGKVAVVDFWATWCGPCRAAMKEHEPHKDKYLDKDVVFVYLSGETSPRKQWEIVIADVRGDHYYLSDSQWKAVCNKFNVTGIPSWVVVNKKGEYLKESLYSPEEWEKVIDRELEK